MLSSGSVDGIFLDKFTFMHAVSFAKDAAQQHSHHHDSGEMDAAAAKFFLEKTHRTKVNFEGEKMSYGLVVKEEKDYTFFEEFIRHNQVQPLKVLRIPAAPLLDDRIIFKIHWLNCFFCLFLLVIYITITVKVIVFRKKNNLI